MKASRLFTLLIALCLFSFATAQEPQKRKKVAVVLSGGGAKGMAHIGALRVIEKAGIPIDIITGTSMGSIVGGLYAIGYDSHRLDSMVRVQDWTFLLSDKKNIHSPFLYERKNQNTYFLSKTLVFENKKLKSNMGGFIEGRNLSNLFNKLTAGYTDSMDFNKLPIPFACVATNIMDNTEYDFHSGVLANAMRTSMSIPGVFAPIRKGDKVLVDGGLRNNFPADIAREMGADIIIGVTVQGAPKTANDLGSGTSVLSQIVDVNCKNKYDDNLAITDLPIRVNTKGYSSASFTPDAIDTLINRGEQEAMSHWDELMALKKKIGIDNSFKPRQIALNPATASTDTVAEDSTRTKAHMIQANLGVRFDTEEMVALQLGASVKPKNTPFEIDFTGRLGKRIMGKVDFYFLPLHYSKMRLSYIYRHNDLNIYYKGDRDFNVTYNQHSAELSLINLNIRNFTLDFGARFDYYHYQDILVGKVSGREFNDLPDSHFFSYFGKVSYNSENNWYFPTRGALFDAGYIYYTDNFLTYKDHSGIGDIHASWRMSYSINSRLTFQPMLYGRIVYGHDKPLCLYNMIGGDWSNHYLDYQMPFAGIGYVETIHNNFIALQLKLQQRIADRNYVILKIAGAQHNDKFENLLKHGPMMGYQLSYYYNSLFGPLGASLGYSNRTQKAYFYINLGFEF
jgi:NTE family protein